MQNVSVLLEESKANSFLSKVYETYSGCLPTTSNVCPALTSDQLSEVKKTSLWTAYAIKAAYVLAKLLKETHNSLCHGENGVCNRMRNRLPNERGLLIEKLRNGMNITFQYDFPFVPIALTNMSLQFDTGNNVKMVTGLPDYEVFQYIKRSDGFDSFYFEKIGTYRTPELHLQLSQIKDYQTNNDGASWPDIIRAQCKEGKTCKSCILEDPSESVYFRNGDVLLGGIFPIYNGGTDNPLSCGDIRTSEGNELVMAMEYIVELINNRTKPYDVIFKGKTVGMLVINSCDQPLLIQNKLTKLFGNDSLLQTGEVIDINKILGFLAAYSSSLSVTTSRILSEFGYTQVAYATTAAELSDREKYPYFSRVTTPDTKQAKAIISIVTHRHYRSDYIQIVYSKGWYGESGLVAIKKEATKHDVCIVQEIEIDDGDNFNAVLQKLRRKPFAKIVILFIRAHQVDTLVVTLNDNMAYGEFFFIASEAWGFRPSQFTDKLKFVGTIILSLQLPENKNFTDYLHSNHISSKSHNPWLSPYTSAKYTCHVNSSFDKTYKDPCSARMKLAASSGTCRQGIWTSFVLRATNALLGGSYEAFKNICGPEGSKLCDNYRRYPLKVRNYTLKQKVDVDGSGYFTNIFDENGDGIVDYTIYNLKRKSADRSILEYVQVGTYDLQEDKLDLDTNTITLPDEISMPSTCPNTRACEACRVGTDKSITGSTSSDSGSGNRVLGSFVGIFLLVIVILAVIVFILHRRLKVRRDELYEDEQYDQIRDGPRKNTVYGVANVHDNCRPAVQPLVPTRNRNVENRPKATLPESRESNSYLHLSQVSHMSMLYTIPDDDSSKRYTNCDVVARVVPVNDKSGSGIGASSSVEETEFCSSNRSDEIEGSKDISVYLTPPSPESVQKYL